MSAGADARDLASRPELSKRLSAARFAGLLAILLAAAPLRTASAQLAQPAMETVTAAPKTCQADENGAKLLDRGMGGTGIGTPITTPAPTMPAMAATPAQLADRGFGGTGITPQPLPASDRGMGGTGIGGTGIVGVITGFGSICLDGLEVFYNENAPVIVDGSSESPDILRAGQLAVVKAKGTIPDLSATDLEIRHEVSGPVSDVENGGRLLIVAGQTVTISDEVWGDTAVQRGDWIEVSGLRTPNADIAATRIDRRLPGKVLVYGKLVASAAGLRVGGLFVTFPAGAAVPAGQNVQLSGRFADGVLYVDDTAPDRFVADPVAYFGPETRQFVVDSYVEMSTGMVQFGPERVRAGSLSSFFGNQNGRGVMLMRRQRDGSLSATALHSAPMGRIAPHGTASSPSAARSRDFGNSFNPDRGVSPQLEPRAMPNGAKTLGPSEATPALPAGTALPFPLSAPNGFGGLPGGRSPGGR